MARWFSRAKRTFALVALGASLGAGLVAGEAHAQANYPDRPVHIILPFGAGGLADGSIRLVAEKLSDRFGKQFVVENVPGGGGVAAANAALRASADGHTIILISNGTAISEALYENLPYDTARDFMPISTVAWYDMVLLTNPNSPYKTVKDAVAAAQAKPGTLNIGTINPGSTQNLSAELFKSLAKIDATLIPYRNTPDVLVALLRSDIDLAIDAYTALKGQIDSGEVRALAVTGLTRNPAMPNVPTMKEAGLPDYEVSGWNALFVKAGTPPEIVARLNKELAAITQMPDIKEKYAGLGIEARATTPEVLSERLKADIAKWSDVIEKAGIKKLRLK